MTLINEITQIIAKISLFSIIFLKLSSIISVLVIKVLLNYHFGL
jgi:hypothetical protein